MLLWPAIAKMRAEPRPPIKLGTEPFTRKPISPPRASRAAYGNVIQKSYIAADTLQHTYRLESSQVERMRSLGMCNDRRHLQNKAAIQLEFLMSHQSEAKAVQLTFMSDAFLMTYRVAIQDGPLQRILIK